MSKKIELTVRMQVTEAQALALTAMFDYWDKLGSQGSSRAVGFFVDGNGNFQPKCEVTVSEPIHPLTSEMVDACTSEGGHHGPVMFDYDAISAMIGQ